MPTIRPYQPADLEAVIELEAQLQDHVGCLDTLGKQRTKDDFDAPAYCARMFEKIEAHNGAVFVVEENGTIIGFVSGIIEGQSDDALLDRYPTKEGEVLELVVNEEARGMGVGSLLMEEMENYFVSNDCDFVRLVCFTPNEAAHAFYEKSGYHDRYTGMIKDVKKLRKNPNK